MTHKTDPTDAIDPGAVTPGVPDLPAQAGKPMLFQVLLAGMSARDERLVKVLMRHDPDPFRRFEAADPTAAVPPIILLANPFDTMGVRAIAAARSEPGIFAVVHALPAKANAQTRFSVQLERLSLQLMPCLKSVVELAFEASPPGETLFCSASRANAQQPRAADSAPSLSNTGEAGGAGGSTGLGQRCDVLVVDVVDWRAESILAAFAESVLTARRCEPAGLMGAVANREADLVVLSPDPMGFDLALALHRQRSNGKTDPASEVVLMMLLDKGSFITYARAKLAGCSIVLTWPLDSERLVPAARKALRRLRDRRRKSESNAPSGPAAGFSTPWLDTGTGH